MRVKEIQACKSEHMENVAAVLLRYDGLGTNDEILQALESKYDALRDKLLLEALRKQLGMVVSDFEYFKCLQNDTMVGEVFCRIPEREIILKLYRTKCPTKLKFNQKFSNLI